MKMKSLAAAVAFCVSMVANDASALQYSFSYTDTGFNLSGLLEGSLQADNDTIFVDDFGPVTFNGTLLADIEPADIVSISDFPVGALQPLVSISGTSMDVFVCAQGFSSGNCSFANDGGFLLQGSTAFAGNGLGLDANTSLTTGNWTISEVSAVPVPATLPLLAAGLAGFGFMMRRKRSAA
ncbi:VPLPA-CTERM sorting domain-containing protein [Rhodobacteraceae bacterium NNCM2]|nr:VPLPA-CTERM sorting domain-containing protein [Coraliihabitans acroporae]